MNVQNVPVDPKELDRAQRGWVKFTKLTTLAVLVSLGVLVFMAIFLL